MSKIVLHLALLPLIQGFQYLPDVVSIASSVKLSDHVREHINSQQMESSSFTEEDMIKLQQSTQGQSIYLQIYGDKYSCDDYNGGTPDYTYFFVKDSILGPTNECNPMEGGETVASVKYLCDDTNLYQQVFSDSECSNYTDTYTYQDFFTNYEACSEAGYSYSYGINLYRCSEVDPEDAYAEAGAVFHLSDYAYSMSFSFSGVVDQTYECQDYPLVYDIGYYATGDKCYKGSYSYNNDVKYDLCTDGYNISASSYAEKNDTVAPCDGEPLETVYYTGGCIGSQVVACA